MQKKQSGLTLTISHDGGDNFLPRLLEHLAKFPLEGIQLGFDLSFDIAERPTVNIKSALTGAADKMRVTLEPTDFFRNIPAAIRAWDFDCLIIKHKNSSIGLSRINHGRGDRRGSPSPACLHHWLKSSVKNL